MAHPEQVADIAYLLDHLARRAEDELVIILCFLIRLIVECFGYGTQPPNPCHIHRGIAGRRHPFADLLVQRSLLPEEVMPFGLGLLCAVSDEDTNEIADVL